MCNNISIEKKKKDDLDKEIEYLVIDDDENEIEETCYKLPPLVHSREKLKTSNKMLEKVDDKIKGLGQMPLHLRKGWKILKK